MRLQLQWQRSPKRCTDALAVVALLTSLITTKESPKGVVQTGVHLPTAPSLETKKAKLRCPLFRTKKVGGRESIRFNADAA
jgi:hypothetical protein